mgnify:CR=1 FL=1
MELIIIGSSSKGNSYALRADSGAILLLEAGVPLREVKKAIGYQTSKVKAVIVSHVHSDHAKYIPEYVKAGLNVLSNVDVSNHYKDLVCIMDVGQTYHMGCSGFRVTPFDVEHDVPNFGYLIYHPEVGTIFFATDCYNLKFAIRGVNIFLAECNYSDELLNKTVREGKTPASQADRVRLSHMSLEHCISWLEDCEASKSAHQIFLIHGSARHLDPKVAVSLIQRLTGVPTWYAKKGKIIPLVDK